MKLVLLIFLLTLSSVYSQNTIPSYFPTRCIPEQSLKVTKPSFIQKPIAPLEKEVMGWHPYWASATAHTNYDYSVLNHLSYFGYELKADGTLFEYQSSVDDSIVISYAKEQGCKTSITIICFDKTLFTTVYDDYDKTDIFFENLVNIVERLQVDEVIFDFEPLSSFPQDKIHDFLLEARFALYFIASEEEIKLSMAMPAVDWTKNINLQHYSEDLDKLIVMAYDYYYSGSPTAGPVSPLTGEVYNVQNTIAYYLSQVPNDKLIIAYPWYGYDWPVSNTQRKATASGTATARTLSVMKTYTSQNTPTFDTATNVPWLNYTSSQMNFQVWYEDSLSLANKYFEITKNDLAGVGIWALNYASGEQYAWSEIRNQFEREVTSVSEVSKGVSFQNVCIERTESIQLPFITKNVAIYSTTGLKLVEKNISQNTLQFKRDFSIETTGVYLVECSTENGNVTRFVVLLR